MNKKFQRLTEPSGRLYLFVLVAFAAAALLFGQYVLAAAEGAVLLLLIISSVFSARRRRRELMDYIESVTYDADTAKNNTLLNFPLPMAVFSLNDLRVIWANQIFFNMCGVSGSRFEARLDTLVPQFSAKWLLEGKTQCQDLLAINGRKYQIHGNIIRPGTGEEEAGHGFMGIAYWVDVTEYDDVRIKYEESRPVVGVLIIDNYDELIRNQPDRVKNDLRDAVEDVMNQYWEGRDAILRRYDRDRYFVVFEERHLDEMRSGKFALLEQAHSVIGSAGIHATLSLGLGHDGEGFGEDWQFATLAAEMALSRGGDQAVIKNRLSFEFFGGRGNEVETRTKVKSRVMANALAELIADSSRVFVMGHKYADLDAVGADAAICCLARKKGKLCRIVIDPEKNASKLLIERLQSEPEYKSAFITPQEAMLQSDGRSLLVVVDTNRPEQAEDANFLAACNRVAVIDHHRRAATYIQNSALTFYEPYASSTCELLSEVLQEVCDPEDILRCEAEAMLSGIVLDTKNFTLRTGERTFEAAAFLRRCGADTVEVKKLLQNDMNDTVARYRIMQNAQLYRGNIAVAAPESPQDRVIIAQAADELLNISGVEVSFVVSPTKDGGANISARSIGDINVQVIMEKLGGGGNRSAAACQIPDTTLRDAVNSLFAAIDEYLDG
ncbi:MAG TPA: DHH family phosphoesterase [Candidatus Scatomorpha gallistercoris]|nr:DHH family phosphoesterase [Candidatus Scatomorpha gallistercoris]